MTITFASNNTAAATVSPASLAFGPANYSVPQVVAVTAVDNLLVDGTRRVRVNMTAASSDAAWQGLRGPNVTVVVADNDLVSRLASRWEGPWKPHVTGAQHCCKVLAVMLLHE